MLEGLHEMDIVQ